MRLLSTDTCLEAQLFLVSLCSPEDAILAKLDWHKKSGGALDRQLRDMQTVMMVQTELDLDYLRLWSERLGVREQLEASLRDAGR